MHVQFNKQLKLNSDLSRQYIENPDSLKDYLDARINSRKYQLHLEVQAETMEEVDGILQSEAEY